MFSPSGPVDPRLYQQLAAQNAQRQAPANPAKDEEEEPDMMKMLLMGILPGLGGSIGQGAMGGLLPMLAGKKIPGLLGGE